MNNSDLVMHIEKAVFQYLEIQNSVLRDDIRLVIVFVPVIGIFLERDPHRVSRLLALHTLERFRYHVGFAGFKAYPDLRYLWEYITDLGPLECFMLATQLRQIDPLLELYERIRLEAQSILPKGGEDRSGI